ncbi:MAG: TetR/AcrR family transcriptional regulator, regulator of autoinduction and epiphytic fitness [Clostridiales bacterium]|jgi:TetR/AcrR family transcriptional regulator of autoinduction and epiphytic fitness|nr:TetR/AcrR family transcriptional regulator [Pygmaiobacter sp.]MDK2814002.1 TetR/AcrR family transcriptional regulator, regulator of autoinduction and epiphytic fitness [Clostridiales bacterium]
MEDKKSMVKKSAVAKRQKILEGAMKVFTENGFDASSMDHIAQTAGVSKITVYKYFQSKENLFQEIVSDFLLQSDEKKPITYSKTRPIRDQLMDFAMAELYRVKDPIPRGVSKLLASVYLFKPDLVKQTLAGKHFYEDFTIWLEAAKQDGALTFETAALTAQIFYGMMEGCLTWNILLTDGATLPYVEPILAEILDVFLCRYGTQKVKA